ncbi:SIR2 family NAD-dependent protein deacylase [Anaeromicropila herbilytica]|uniref:Deacetylase sirtuin-type domain-containing protein n=1 Tax=Anaeromicropila herbilytica TaxID=2785025 RepID=A0A7R7EJT7_9FIRM|nr:hypothetical protein [Anaeromicropila herbilytica]BCN30445.1 hypothetical protein bsdtb5_17400 [Anaeromicropila herbilytica]
MNDINENVIKAIHDAEYVLIGCGTELSIDSQLEKDDFAKEILRPLNKYGIYTLDQFDEYIKNKEVKNWLETILTKYFHNRYSDVKVYDKLYELLNGKEYFIITTNVDNLIFKSKLDSNKIVAPCGNDTLLQCENACTHDLWDGLSYINSVIEELDNINLLIKEGNWSKIEEFYPKCKTCNGKAVFNVKKETETYIEEGYLSQWNVYLNWLMRTLNRNILMLELGENFDNPTVIRWAFEKNTFINNKAKLIRINKTFSQLTEEIKSKSMSIPMNASDFLKQL